MAENLKVTHYRNGDEIPNITNNGDWGSLSTGAYGDYDNNPSNSETYGRFYNWYTVDDSRGICPEGWHIPSDDEFKTLEVFLGMSQEEADNGGYRGTNEGSKLAGNGDLWVDGILEQNEEFGTSGFNVLPAGYRHDNGVTYYMGDRGYFWFSTENFSNYAWFRGLSLGYSEVDRGNWNKQYGCSVRCIEDEITTGCTDPESCNYDESATADDGSCEYLDECGVCDGDNSYCADCAGTPNGDLEVDECGVCGGDGIDEGACDCDGNVEDCAGDCGGDSSCLSTLSFGALNIGYDEHSVEILLDNPNSNLGGFQFTLTVSPNILVLVDVSGGLADSTGFITDFNDDNNIIVGYNLDGNTIDDVMGVLTSLDLNGFVGTEQVDLCITSALLTDPSGENLYDVDVGGCITIVNQLGDTNIDGVVNVLDVVFIVNLVLQNIEPTEYEQWAADINGDGLLNIQDIVMTINIILPDDGLARSEPIHDARIDIYSDRIQVSSDGIIAGVELHTLGNYTITSTALPEGWEFYQDNEIILLVDMDGTGISDDMTLYFDGTMQIKNNLLSDWSGNGISASLNIIPDAFILESAYPNPFNPVTTIGFALPEDGNVAITIYNMAGQQVHSLVSDNKDAGYHTAIWNASEQSSGIYFVKMVAGDYISTQKLMLVK